MKKLASVLLIISIFWTIPAHAFFQKIWKGYLAAEENQINEIDKKLIDIEFVYQASLYTWDFSLNAGLENSNPAGLISFQNQETGKQSIGFNLNKNTYKFGTFTFAHSQIQYDLSKWTNRTFLPNNANELYEAKNSLTYNYDFLDRSSNYTFDLALINRDVNQLRNSVEQQKQHLNFFKTYLEAKADVFGVKLTKEFIKRAQKRVNQVNKRVKDGIARSVDLTQAKTALLTQKENLNTTRSSLKTNLSIIEYFLKTKVPESVMEQVTWVKRPLSYWEKSFTLSESIEVELAKKNIVKSNLELEKFSDQNGMQLDLSASYILNSVNESRSKALANANGAGDNKSQAIALVWTIPLGMDRNDSVKQKLVYTQKKNELELIKVSSEVGIQKDSLRVQIKLLEEAYDIASEKVKLAKITLDQQTNLYERGQVVFEEVIRSEESLISNQLNQSKIIAQYEFLLAQYAYLNNGIVKFLDKYTD